jgi:membrane fusion protein, multidrug efflux system
LYYPRKEKMTYPHQSHTKLINKKSLAMCLQSILIATILTTPLASAADSTAGKIAQSNSKINATKPSSVSASKPELKTNALKPDTTSTPATSEALGLDRNKALTSHFQESTAQIRVLLIPEKETTISSTIAARIVEFNGALGRSFKMGDTLVSFDCEEALARVEMSKAELSGAIDQHEAKVKMQGLDQASDVEVSLAASAVNKAKAQLSLNKTQVSQCRIYAPWSGRVAKANVKNNMTVTPGQALMELVNAGPLKLKLNAPSKLLGQLKIGTKFNVTIDETGQSYEASVSAINSRVDPVSQTVEIEARLTKHYIELLAGMSGVATLSARGH